MLEQNETSLDPWALFDTAGLDLVDAHCHLGFARDPQNVAARARGLGLGAWCCTVTPGEYARLRPLLTGESNVALGLGLHPWWIGCGRAPQDEDAPAAGRRLEEFLSQLDDVRLVGEVGLDYSARRADTAPQQRAALREILATCARLGGKTLSIHCVRAHDDLFSLIEETRVAESCRLVLHWFSGSNQDLTRAIGLGCCFSVGPRMLATRRGRAYAGQMPAGRILLETDFPQVDALAPGFEPVDFDVEGWRGELFAAQKALNALG